MANIWELSVWIKADKNTLKKATSEIKKEFDITSKDLEWNLEKWAKWWVKKIKNAFRWLSWYIAWIFAVWVLVEFTKNLFSLTSQIEKAKISFETLLWSQEKAVDMLDKLDIFASKTPFNKLELIKSTQKLLWFWFAWKQVLPVMRSVWDAVSAVWWNQETLNWVILALWQIKAKWKLSAEELMQMAERWLPVFEILENKLNLTKDQIWNIWNAGITASEAIPALLEWFNEKFAGSLDKQSQTLDWKWSNLIDNIQSKLSKIWEALWPLFSFVIDKINLIVPPILNFVLFLVKTFKAWFDKIKLLTLSTFNTLEKAFLYLKNNAEKILKALVSIFLSALVIMKRWVILDFVKTTTVLFLSSMKKMYFAVLDFLIIAWVFTKNIWKISKQVAINTFLLWKNTLAKVKNTLASIKLSFVNLRTALSFRVLWKAIISATKRIIFLASRFFFIGAIVFTIVTAIYKNWDKLKEKLKPLFEYIWKIWQKAPEIISDAWNFLVDVIAWSIKLILWWAEKIVKALNNIPWVDINTDGITKAVEAVDSFWESMKFTAEDVKWAFDNIKDWAKNAGEFIKSDVLWFWNLSEGLDESIFDIKSAFDDVWDETGKLEDKAKGSVDNIKSEYDSLKDNLEKLEESQKDLKDKTIKYNDEIKKSIENIWDSLDENKRKYDDELKSIKKSRDEKLWENTKKKDEDIARALLELEDDLKSKNKDLESEEDSEEKNKILEDIAQLNKDIAEAKALVNEEILEEIRNYESLSEIWKIAFDSNKEKKAIKSDSIKKEEEAQKEFEAEQRKLEDMLRVNEFFLNRKGLNEKELNQILNDENFKQFDKEVQDLILKLAREKIELTRQKDEAITLQEEINRKTIELSNKTTKLLWNNVNKLKWEYRKLIDEINKAIAKQRQFNREKKSSSWGYADGWYTWDWWKYEPAWIVHKWEYVINQDMIKKMPWIVSELEKMRNWNTSNDYSKNIEVWWVTVNSELDFDMFFDELKFKL